MKQRIEYIDLCKCIAIWLVLWGHILPSLGGEQMDDGAKWVGDLIYAFHMPLFMILSGLFASSALKRPLHIMIWQKFRQLVWPCITFGVILGGLYNYWGINQESLQHGVVFFGLFYDYWFLHCLFANFCLAWIVYRFRRCLQTVVFVLSYVVIIFMFMKGHNLFNMATMTFPFFVGIELKKHLPLIEKHSKSIMIVFSLLFVFFFIFYKQEYNGTMYFFSPLTMTTAMEFVYREAIGIIGSLAIVTNCHVVYNKVGYNILILRRIGGGTLQVYLIQGVILECILAQYVNFSINGYFFRLVLAPIISVILLLFFHYMAVNIKKNYVINVILFGKR